MVGIGRYDVYIGDDGYMLACLCRHANRRTLERSGYASALRKSRARRTRRNRKIQGWKVISRRYTAKESLESRPGIVYNLRKFMFLPHGGSRCT